MPPWIAFSSLPLVGYQVDFLLSFASFAPAFLGRAKHESSPHLFSLTLSTITSLSQSTSSEPGTMAEVERRNFLDKFRTASWSTTCCLVLMAMMMGKPLMSFSPIRMPSRSTVFGAPRAGTGPLLMTEEDQAPAPTSFREAEVLGLKLMQEGNFEEALTSTCKKFLERLILKGLASNRTNPCFRFSIPQ